MLFDVFFSDNGECRGGRFRLLTQSPEVIRFPEEYAVVDVHNDELAVRFFQRGQCFEFCGAGALCLAHRYAPEYGVRYINHSSFAFAVGRCDGRPAVVLPLVAPGSDNNGVSLFPAQGVAVCRQPSIAAVDGFIVDWRSLRAVGCSTAIAIYCNQSSLSICFRYFTAFNHKGEDQATGSVFRYLAALSLQDDVWYSVCQRSRSGAEMRCCKRGNQLWFTGNVRSVADPGGDGHAGYSLA